MKRLSIKRISIALCIVAFTLPLGACAREPSNAVADSASSARETASQPAATSAAALTLPVAIVHKTPTCGCCGSWVEHLQEAGFGVEVRDTGELYSIKERLGVPYGKASCHTAEIGGYVVEGHVPAEDIKRLLRDRPRARGLVLPGMPVGSPGMEVPDGTVQPYTVELVMPDGTSVPYAAHGG